jgi:heme A synthase
VALLAYNVAVVLWGAFVRATGSGAGCGSHWPLCNGDVVPREPTTATLIELTHRLTSGLALVGVVVLFVLARRVYPTQHRVRRATALSLALMITEALLGAGLVLLEHVAHNPSEMRGVSVSLHLVNTFALLAALTATTFWANGGRGPWRPEAESAGPAASIAPATGAVSTGVGAFAARTPFLRLHRAVVAWLLPALLGVVLLGATGAIAALGDLLFPVRTFGEGLAQDVSPTAHLFVRLRVLHPALAVVVGAYAVFAAGILRALRPSRSVRVAARGVAVLFVVQMALGLANVTLLAPVPLQLLHLFFADVLWLTLIVLTLAALSTAPHVGTSQVGGRPLRSSASATSASPAREASATG